MSQHQRTLIGLFIGLAVGLGGPRGAVAADQRAVCPICRQASDDTVDYPTKAGHTLVRGATNTLLGWTELLRQPAQEVKEGGGVFTGIAKGLGQSVTRTFAGAGELLTFWTPKVRHRYLYFARDCPVCMGKR
jgi:putative exosortase-associated protein (TIGR04073 family)